MIQSETDLFIEHWSEIRDHPMRAPLRDRLDLNRLRPLIGYLMMTDGPEREFRIRLFGEKLSRSLGEDATGRRLHDLFGSAHYSTVRAAAQMAAIRHQPVRIEILPRTSNTGEVLSTLILAPLRGTPGEPLRLAGLMYPADQTRFGQWAAHLPLKLGAVRLLSQNQTPAPPLPHAPVPQANGLRLVSLNGQRLV